MIYVKEKKDLLTIDEAITKYPFNHFKAYKRLITRTLKALNYDIDIYIDLKNTCYNPLGQFIIRCNYNKQQRYKRINEKYFVIVYLNRLKNFINYYDSIHKTNLCIYTEFKKTFYHELLHYKRRLQLDNNIIDRIQYKIHDRILPGQHSKNNINILKSELLRG